MNFTKWPNTLITSAAVRFFWTDDKDDLSLPTKTDVYRAADNSLDIFTIEKRPAWTDVSRSSKVSEGDSDKTVKETRVFSAVHTCTLTKEAIL